MHVDPRLTSAALAHVLENAGQYSPAGSAIDVNVTVDTGELRIAVRDRGIGIKVHEQQRVFAGRQQHRLRRDGGSFRIVQKRVDLINCDSAFDAMAVPI